MSNSTECGDGCTSTYLEQGTSNANCISNLLDTTSCIATDYSTRPLSGHHQIDSWSQQYRQAQQHQGSTCYRDSSSLKRLTASTSNTMMEHRAGDGAGAGTGAATSTLARAIHHVESSTKPLHEDDTNCASATTAEALACDATEGTSATAAASSTCNTSASANDDQSNVTKNSSTTTTAVSADVAAAAAAAQYTLKSLSSTLQYHDNEAHVLHQHQQPLVASNYVTGGSNTIQTLHQFRVSSHQQQQHHHNTLQNKTLMHNGKVQTSILKKSTSAVSAAYAHPYPGYSSNINQCLSPTPYMTSSKSADSISNLTSTLDRHTVRGCGGYGATRRATHLNASSALPSSFSSYSFNYNLINNTSQQQPQPPFSSIASPTCAAGGSQTQNNNSNFKRNSSSIIPLRHQPIGNQNFPDVFCHNHSAVMPSDSYHSFFTPSSNSISTIPQAYEYHPLCSNAASPCEEKSHFGKLGTEGAEVVVHTSTGGPPVSCRDLIVLTFIAAILMGMTLAFLVTLWFFLEQIECTSEGNCKNRHAPFT